MDGVELSARFALPPNFRTYCGTPSFRNALAEYLGNKNAANSRALCASLAKFKAHYAYLRLIAKANGRKPFDRSVTEALWIGNGLLAKVKGNGLAILITEEFSGKGLLTPEKARRLAENIPPSAAPHHSFHVLYLHTITGVVRPRLSTADLCRPGWGKVMKAGRSTLEVQSQKLALKNGKLALVPCRKKLRRECAGIVLVPEVKKGEWVASHWGIAVMRLTESQRARLEGATRKNIAALGGSHKLQPAR